MTAIRTILCPVDFSPATSRQVALAADLCRALDARLVLHHNLSAVAIGAGVGWMWAADHPPVSDEAIHHRLGALVESLPGLDVQVSVTRGPDAAAVVAVGNAVGADVVVLTTHNVPQGEHTSVAEQVLDAGHRTVLALHDVDAGGGSFAPGSTRRQVALVPADPAGGASPAVDFAFDLARRLPLDIHLLDMHQGGRRAPGRDSGAVAERGLRALVPADREAAVHIDADSPRTSVVQWAGTLGAACVVIGDQARGPLRRWFSRDAARVLLHDAPCPVWYVPAPRAA